MKAVRFHDLNKFPKSALYTITYYSLSYKLSVEWTEFLLLRCPTECLRCKRIVRRRVSSWEFQASQILLEIRCFRNPNLANKHRIVRRIYCDSNFAPKIEHKINRRCAKDHSNLYKSVLLKEILKHHSKYKSLFCIENKHHFSTKPRPTVQNGVCTQILDKINPSHSYFRTPNSLPRAGNKLYILRPFIKVSQMRVSFLLRRCESAW